VGLERGPLSLVSTTEELLGRKSEGSGLENREYGRRDPSRLPRGTLCPQMLALTSPTSGCRSVSGLKPRCYYCGELLGQPPVSVIFAFKYPDLGYKPGFGPGF
jgi:hypothetical protein